MLSLAIALTFQIETLKDVHIAAMPLDKAITQLSSIYNSPMDASVLLRNKIILVDATQVSESEVREQIAKTLNASWEKKERSMLLQTSFPNLPPSLVLCRGFPSVCFLWVEERHICHRLF